MATFACIWQEIESDSVPCVALRFAIALCCIEKMASVNGLQGRGSFIKPGAAVWHQVDTLVPKPSSLYGYNIYIYI